jgi:beta-phosphoglucomutase
MTRRGLLLDFDGVIIDSEPAHAAAKRLVLERAGIAFDDGLFARWKGRTDVEFFAHILADTPPGAGGADQAALLEAKRAAYREVFEERVALVEGVDAFLATARATFERIALATSATLPDFELAAARFDLRRHFDAIVTAADTTRHKPDPEPYLVALARLGLEPDEAMAVDDSPNGVRSAAASGVLVVGLAGAFDARALREAGAHETAPGLAALAADLDRLHAG